MDEDLHDRVKQLELKLAQMRVDLDTVLYAPRHPSPYVSHFPGNHACSCMYCRMPVVLPDAPGTTNG